jgi:hypothetical protein
VKVAASQLRKGSVVDLSGKLYVVLTAQNIHPGKGTPVTQLDMRRISDGVKVSERYRTTEPVVKGQTASGSYKPAILANGLRIMIPTYITVGTKVVVHTEDGSYMERAKE